MSGILGNISQHMGPGGVIAAEEFEKVGVDGVEREEATADTQAGDEQHRAARTAAVACQFEM